jgi:adenylate cyclase
MPSDESRSAIVFADITGTTSLVEQLGDAPAHALIRSSFDSMEELVDQFGGRTLRRAGDEFLAAFAEAASGLLFAIAAHRHPGLEGGGRRLGLRIGVHFGTVVQDDAGDVFGDAIKVGSRLCALASAGQVITTGETMDALPGGVTLAHRSLGEHTIPGRARPLHLVEVLSAQHMGSLTQTLRPIDGGERGGPVALRLTWHGTTMEIRSQAAGQSITIGRDSENLLVVAANAVSRNHATLEGRNGKFYLVDHSTNGTWVNAGGERAVHVRRETVLLMGRGTISLGCKPSDAGGDALSYEIR